MKAEFIFDYQEPIICTAIHNGHQLREEVQENLGISEADQLREEDPYTEFFTEIVNNRIVVQTSRFEVDLNRSPDMAVYIKPEDAWGLPVRKTEPLEEVVKRSMQGYQDFYQELKLHIEQMLKQHSKIFIYDLHSYNHHRLGPDQPFDDPEKNPEIILGTNNMPSEWFPLVEEVRELISLNEFKGRKIDCRVNVKFTGGYFSRWLHHFYPEQVCCIALEFKKIFMDEWSGIRNESEIETLREILKSTLPLIGKRFEQA